MKASLENFLVSLRRAKLHGASMQTTRVLLRAYAATINAEVLVASVDADAERDVAEYGALLGEIGRRVQDEPDGIE